MIHPEKIMSFTTRPSILSGIRKQDEYRCQDFCMIYEPLIRLHGKDCGIGETDIDDLVQLVLLEFFSANSFAYDRDKGRFRNYMRRVIRAKAADLLRSRYRYRKIIDKFGTPEEEERLDRYFDIEYCEVVLAGALEKLRRAIPAEHYQIFLASVSGDINTGLIAEKFRNKRSTVYSIIRRAKGKLAAIIKLMESDPEY